MPIAFESWLCGLLQADIEVLAFRHAEDRPSQVLDRPQDHFGADPMAGEAEGRAVDEGLHVAAGVDRLGDAREHPERRTVPALLVGVLDVVVDEREVVDQLDSGGKRSARLIDPPAHSAHERRRRERARLPATRRRSSVSSTAPSSSRPPRAYSPRDPEAFGRVGRVGAFEDGVHLLLDRLDQGGIERLGRRIGIGHSLAFRWNERK